MTQTVKDLFQQSKQQWLHEARIEANRLLNSRSYITIEDVLAECPLPAYLHRNTIGAVFKNDDYQAIGFTQARKKSSHRRTIRQWTRSGLPSNWSEIKKQSSENI